MGDTTLQQLEQKNRQLEERLKLQEIKATGVDYLRKVAAAQRKRTDVLNKIIDEASLQYLSMRGDILEEMLKDKGPPVWLSFILSAGITVIPFNAISGLFIGALSRATSKIVSRPLRLQLARSRQQTKIEAKEKVWNKQPGNSPAQRREWRDDYVWGAVARRRLKEQIKQTDTDVAKFVSIWQPELEDRLRQIGNELVNVEGKQMLPRLDPDNLNEKLKSTNTPVVQVRLALKAYVDVLVDAEDKAISLTEADLERHYKVAVYLTDTWARDKGMKFPEVSGELGPGGYIRSQREWDKKAKEAVQDLKALVRELEPDSEDLKAPPRVQDMLDLMTTIEACMWCLTYDFSIKVDVKSRLSKQLRKEHGGRKWKPLDDFKAPPLPDTTWKKLLERYIDPDSRMAYRDVVSDRLGTADLPITDDLKYSPLPGLVRDLPTTWPPKYRLSFYFSKVLFPQLNSELGEVGRMFRKLKQ